MRAGDRHTLEWIEWVALGLGLVGLLAAVRLSAPQLAAPACGSIGIGLVLEGWLPVLIGRPGEVYRLFVGQEERSPHPWLWALSFSMAGLLLAAAAILVALRLEDQALAYLAQRPGGGLLAAASVMLPIGAAQTIGAPSWQASWRAALATLPRRIIGILLILAGLGCLGLGLLEAIAPRAFDQLIASVLVGS